MEERKKLMNSKLKLFSEIVDNVSIGLRSRDHVLVESDTVKTGKVERQIISSVKELRALAKKGDSEEVAKREDKIIDALMFEMKRNPFLFVVSMLDVLDAGPKYAYSVRNKV